MNLAGAARGRREQSGFTYLALLVAVALLGLGLTAASDVWSTVARRERHLQGDWAGRQIAQAIGSYYETAPGGAKSFPDSLDALLEDRRGPTLRRHLRRIYRNPFDATGQWQLLLGGDAKIRGVATAASGAQARRYVHAP